MSYNASALKRDTGMCLRMRNSTQPWQPTSNVEAALNDDDGGGGRDGGSCDNDHDYDNNNGEESDYDDGKCDCAVQTSYSS